MKPKHEHVKISVNHDDILKYPCDVVVLKFAQMFFGVDRIVADRFAETKLEESTLALPEGQTRLLESHGVIKADQILVVGVKWLYGFGYRDIRDFARLALRSLIRSSKIIRHVAFTLHGAGYGLDEIEAFESEIAGIIDGINSGDFPKTLEQISIVEISETRANRLNRALGTLLSKGFVETDTRLYMEQLTEDTGDRLRSAGYASESKPRVFVAMPFKKEMDDIYYYGIEAPVRKAGFICERADLAQFTGDVLSWIKQRIRGAKIVVADLSTANPNVYLEVGYAWGVNVPTILLANDTSQLEFDVQGQRCLVYDRIKDLEQSLKNELRSLQKL